MHKHIWALLAFAEYAAIVAWTPAHAQMGLGMGMGLSEGAVNALSNNAVPGFVPAGAGFYADFTLGQYWGGMGGTACTTLTSCFNTIRASIGTAVDASGNWTTFAANQPRATSLGLTVEESRTNSQTWSADLTQASAWSLSNVSITTAQSSPDGGSTAQKIVDSTTTSTNHAVLSVDTAAFTAGSTITYSGSFKTAEYNLVQLVILDAAFANGFNATVNTTTGAISGTGGQGTGTFISASAVVYANGWVRVQATGTVGASATQARPAIFLNNGTGTSYPGVIGNGVYNWQNQIEVGSFATTPIPTTSAAVTRQSDIVRLASPFTIPAGGPFSMFGQGTSYTTAGTGAAAFYTAISDGTNNNRTILYRQFNGNFEATMTGGGATIMDVSAVFSGTAAKAASSYAVGIQGASLNGATVGTATSSGTFGAMNLPEIGSDLGSGFFDGTIQKVTYWPTISLSQTQLNQLTQ